MATQEQAVKPAGEVVDSQAEDANESSDYDATEHLMSVDEVSAKYGVQVNKDKPGQSPGLASSDVRRTV